MISNGHGEDEVTVRIIRQLQQLQPALRITALPIVGMGKAYQDQGLSLLMTGQTMPSGGFLKQALGRDLRNGLLGLTRRQVWAIRQWSTPGDVVLAVGDIVPLLLAGWSGHPFAFVGTAKSEYWRADLSTTFGLRQSIYWPWERWLMGRSRGVFPRDSITATALKRWPIPVFDYGNPMMDDLEPQADFSDDHLPAGLRILLLPGSHAPEVFANWQLIVSGISALVQDHKSYLFLGAIASGIDLAPLQQTVVARGWSAGPGLDLSETMYDQGQSHLLLSFHRFREYLHLADIVIAMAGTATEQAVGLGKPVITIPGEGPQFTPQFAALQARHLGRSIYLRDPHQLPASLEHLQGQGYHPQQWIDNGRCRMGPPGAAKRIAHCLQHQLQLATMDL